MEEGQEKVSSQEWEEKSEEKGQEHPRTEASSGQAPLEAMEALAALQMELSSVNEKDPKATSNPWLIRSTTQAEVEKTSDALGTGGGSRLGAAF